MDQTRTERHKALETIERERSSKVIAYVLSPENASVAEDIIPPLFHQLMTMGKQPRLDVILSARGGSPEAAWRILSLIREFTDYLTVIVGYRVFSAAAFLALGADEIIMTPLSELGPVHIQTGSPLAPVANDGNPTWVVPYDILSYFELAKQQGVPPEIYFGELDIHPLVVGSAMRAYNIAKLAAKKCLLSSSNKLNNTQLEKIISAFVGDTPSSSMPFVRKECQDELGLPVKHLPANLDPVLGNLINQYNQLVSYSTGFEQDPISGREARTITPAILESLNLTIVHRRKLERIANPDGTINEVPGFGGWADETIQEAM